MTLVRMIFVLGVCACGYGVVTARNVVDVAQVDLSAIESPILIAGDSRHAYRDPAVVYFEGVFYLYYTFVEIEDDGRIYSYTAFSKSRDLVDWSEKKIITPKDQKLNYCSPGNVIRFNNEYLLFHSPSNGIGLKKSKDLKNWRDAGVTKKNQRLSRCLPDKVRHGQQSCPSCRYSGFCGAGSLVVSSIFRGEMMLMP